MKEHMVAFQKIFGKDPNFKGWDILLHYVLIILGYTYFQSSNIQDNINHDINY